MNDGGQELVRALRGRRGVAPAGADAAAVERPPFLLLPYLWRALPIAIACAFGWQLFEYGLEPVLAERARLAAAHERAVQDRDALLAVHDELLVARAALEDPLYQERRRRWRYERASTRAALPVERDALPTDVASVARAIAEHAAALRGEPVPAPRAIEGDGELAAAPTGAVPLDVAIAGDAIADDAAEDAVAVRDDADEAAAIAAPAAIAPAPERRAPTASKVR